MADAFQPRFVDLVRNYTITQGTGPFALGPPVQGFSSFGSALQAGDQFYYSAIGVDKPNEREVGRGTLLADGTIGRAPISGTPTSFSGGSKTVALIAAAEWFNSVQSSASGVAVCATRTAVAAAASTQLQVLLAEAGREGTFVFDGSNLAAKVAADTMQGIYVAPRGQDGSSGAWVRKFSGPVNATWFGIVDGNASGANGAANSAAWSAMLATLIARTPAALVTTNYQPIEGIYFPLGYYEFASTLELTRATGRLLGDNTGGSSTYGTTFKFPAGVTGIRTQRYNSSGVAAVDTPTHKGGDGWIIDGIALIGAFAGTEAEAHGFHLKSQATIRNFYIQDFEGDGIYAATDTTDSLADSCHIEDGRIVRCRNGMFLDGADSNIWTVNGVSCAANRQWGVWDSSFLGNSYFGLHADSNGISSFNNGSGIAASVVSYNGNRYYVIGGQEAGASTNAPSGTNADNAWWGWLQTGAAMTGIPLWASGMNVRAGGPYRADSANACNVIVGCYSEGGQGRSQLVAPTRVLGGAHAAGIAGSAAWERTSTSGLLTVPNGIGWQDSLATTGMWLSSAGMKMWNASGGQYGLEWQANGDLAFTVLQSALATNHAYQLLLEGTTNPVGKRRMNFPNGFGINSKKLLSGSAAPTTGTYVQGDILINSAPTASGPVLWVCTTPGTPGTWAAVSSGLGTGGVGYSAGAGGAVTQATSKSTGVTLNKLSGQVTMNAASLPAGAAVGFTLTNPQIAATDVVVVSIGTGATANSYTATVDAVAAGSCHVLVHNVSAGALAEALVLNFAVIKAVTA